MTLSSGHTAQLRRASRQLAAGFFSAPVVDIADDSGLLGGLLGLDIHAIVALRPSTWAWLAFFTLLAASFALLFRQHRPVARTWFALSALLLSASYWLTHGLRLSTVIALLLLALGFVSWRIAGDPSLATDG